MRRFFRSVLRFVRQPEPRIPSWKISLPIILFVAYFVARVAGSWFVASVRDEALEDPSVLAILWANLLASVLMVWLILQFVSSNNARQADETRQPPPTFSDSLALADSKSRPLWLIWLAGLAVIIVLDNIALIIGDAQDSLPLGLDRMQNASNATWLSAILFFLLVGPLIEQILLSGMLYPALARRFEDNAHAVLVSVIPFVAFYLVQVVGDTFTWHVIYTGIIYPVILGLTAVTARAHSKSTWGAVGVQAAFGLFLVFKAYLLF